VLAVLYLLDEQEPRPPKSHVPVLRRARETAIHLSKSSASSLRRRICARDWRHAPAPLARLGSKHMQQPTRAGVRARTPKKDLRARRQGHHLAGRRPRGALSVTLATPPAALLRIRPIGSRAPSPSFFSGVARPVGENVRPPPVHDLTHATCAPRQPVDGLHAARAPGGFRTCLWVRRRARRRWGGGPRTGDALGRRALPRAGLAGAI